MVDAVKAELSKRTIHAVAVLILDGAKPLERFNFDVSKFSEALVVSPNNESIDHRRVETTPRSETGNESGEEHGFVQRQRELPGPQHAYGHIRRAQVQRKPEPEDGEHAGARLCLSRLRLVSFDSSLLYARGAETSARSRETSASVHRRNRLALDLFRSIYLDGELLGHADPQSVRAER